LTVTLTNIDANYTENVAFQFNGADKPQLVGWRSLFSMDIHDHNTFDNPQRVEPKIMALDKVDPIGTGIKLPPASVNVLSFKF
jgi:alpha-N-arabinofuranosidase